MHRWIAIIGAAVASAGCRGEPRPVTTSTPDPPVRVASAATDAAPAAPPIDAAPPPRGPDARPPATDDWVDVSRVIPDAVLDMRYARAENFTGKVLYPVARCLLRRSVVERLARAAATLRERGRRLLLWDCYRPAALQKQMWELVKDPRYVYEPVYAADGTPIKGSRHSRGAAIDVGLVTADGSAVTLPTAHDDFTTAAHRKQARKSAGKAELALLEAALFAAGFTGIPTEWWHYDAPDAATFPLADVALDAPP